MLITFENVELNVVENKQHEWLLSTVLVAKGYGVSVDAILKHKQRRHGELIEGKHFLRGVDNLSTQQDQVFWTKRGVVRLGFFIKSKQAVHFRDFAEDLVIDKMESQPLSQLQMLTLPTPSFFFIINPEIGSILYLLLYNKISRDTLSRTKVHNLVTLSIPSDVTTSLLFT